MSDSDSDDENVIRYGTPLEPYEEDEVPSKRKFQQQPDQYAVDAHGRRRFHGAFTGGFSAGFGNTVGTPEGWTPTAFKSSRSEKAQVSSQRPEDFMDEEDRGEHGIAPRHMLTQSEFSGQKRPRQQRYHDGPIPGEPVLHELVRAVHETAAVKILQSMGWREGQGTGDRLNKEDKRKAKEQHKVYGCYMPPDVRQDTQEEENSSESEYDFETLFAPDDYEPYMLSRKNDRFGLGYSGLSRHSVLGTMAGEYGSHVGTAKSHLVMKEKGRKVSIRGQAFGVGAFEADDDDIYATEDMSHYDFALGAAPDDKQKKQVNKDTSNNVLAGFVKSTKCMPPVPSFPPPALPRDYTPLVAGTKRSRFEPTTATPRDQGLGRHELTAEARGALLGETPLPTPVTTQTNLTQSNLTTELLGRRNSDSNTIGEGSNTIPIQKEDPIAKILGRNVAFVSDKKEIDYIPITDSGKELTKIFKPFVGNPQKQKRYERYCEGHTMEGDSEMGRLSKWERERELAEFEQASKLYRPLSGVMEERFTHASEPDDALNPLTAVSKSSANYGLATAEQIEAAKRGVYGVMTRTETEWRPESLVCKRFNVPDPGGVRMEQKKEDKPKVSYSIFSYLESSVHDKDSFAKEQGKFSGSKSLSRDTITSNVEKNSVNINQNKDINIKEARNTFKIDQNKETITKEDPKSETSTSDTGFGKRMTVAELFIKESEKNKSQGEEVTETIEKFDKMDLYKAIFLSDTEEEILESEVDDNSDVDDYMNVPKNIERNTSPPRGIFANIDFDELNSWKRRDDKAETSNTAANNIPKPKANTSKSEDLDVYGPKIPDNLQKRLESQDDEKDNASKPIEIDSSSSEDSWVDANELKNKKQKKKKSKKHKSKHKKKSKSKKKDR